MKNDERKKHKKAYKFLKTLNKELKTSLNTFLILLTIKQKKSANGHEIVEIITKWSEGKIDLNPNIYPLLRHLEKKKLLKAYWSEKTEGPPRKCYKITKNGEIVLEEGLKLLQEVKETANLITKISKEKT
ncbi:MAG: PadR family transcriptional regulator [Candidatus Hodarchaeota archaeon]